MGETVLRRANVRAVVERGDATIAPASLSSLFATHLESQYPLVPVTEDSVDWSLISDSIQIDWIASSHDELIEFVRMTRLGSYDKVGCWYSPWEECLICDLVKAMKDLGELFAGTNGAVYVFGISQHEGEVKGFFDDFIEFDQDDVYTISGRKRVACCQDSNRK